VAVSRFAYEGGTNGITVASTRGVVLVTWVFVFCLLSGRRLRLPRRDWLHCAGLGVLTAMMFYGNVGAVEFIPIGLAALLFFTYPPMIAVINIVVLREAVGAAKLTAVAAGFAGLVLMLGVSFGAADWRGVALVMAAAVAAAWNAVWLARRAAHIDPFVLTFHMALIAAVILLVIAWSSGNVVWPTAPGGWGGLAGVVILQSSGVPLYFIALGLIGALRCGVLINFQPVVSIAAAYLMFGEVLSPVQMLGGAMVLGGIWLAQYSDARARTLDA
jgi:drug/metabolite transporter (DMT)-like permease